MPSPLYSPPPVVDIDPYHGRKIGFNKSYFTSIGGILKVVAMVCALIAMIALESGIHREHGVHFRVTGTTFHEFTVVTSWLFLTIFIALAGFVVWTTTGLSETAMDAIVIGHSALWCTITFISSCVLAGSTNYSPFAASAAFGFLESLALLGVIIVTSRALIKRFRKSSSSRDIRVRDHEQRKLNWYGRH
ncbi:uncharacterized protein LOC129594802 isoform X2 [Paramacrobiotus metropolitanus]|nr:uncharacterized protein LOC129594802 isoform X2 [Paramacrobiotus metropolitanus]XP_055347594.1 uncharacterized protein LOC129594802 isoform X2 [Paramacrobiotus metropolitanus]